MFSQVKKLQQHWPSPGRSPTSGLHLKGFQSRGYLWILKDGQSCSLHLKMGDIHVWRKSQNKFTQKQAFQWKHWSIKKLQAKEKYYGNIHSIMWEGWTFAVWICSTAFSQKKIVASAMSLYSFRAVPGRGSCPPIHWVLKWWETTCIFNH